MKVFILFPGDERGHENFRVNSFVFIFRVCIVLLEVDRDDSKNIGQ